MFGAALIRRLTHFGMVPLLAVSVACELLLNRIGWQLTKPDGNTNALLSMFDRGGLFFFYFTGFIALFVGVWGIWTFIRHRSFFPTLIRLPLAVVGAAFVSLAAIGLIVELPKLAQPALNLSFGLLLVTLLIAHLQSRASIRAKLGSAYLIAPLLFHCYWLASKQLPSIAPPEQLADLPNQLYVTGEHLVIVSAFAAFLFFIPHPRWRIFFNLGPLAFASIVTALVGRALYENEVELAKLAYLGFKLNLPAFSWVALLYLAALFVFCITVGNLLRSFSRQREIGWGLLLLALSGYHLELPYQLLISSIGVMQLIRATFPVESEHSGHGWDGII